MNKILITLLCALVIFCIIFNLDAVQLKRKGAYQYVMEGDKEDMHERLFLVKKEEGELAVKRLLFAFLSSSNRDVLTKQTAVLYINKNRIKEFLPVLKQVKREFEKIPSDSAWEVQITPLFGRRTENVKKTYFYESLCGTIELLSTI